jgi:hypothetical protein
MQTNQRDDLRSLEVGLDSLQLGDVARVQAAWWKRLLPPIAAITVVRAA